MSDTNDVPKGQEYHDRKGKFAAGNTARSDYKAKRQRGIAKYIGAQTANGQELVDAALEVARDKASPLRMKAIDWLALRFMGKPVEKVEVTGANGKPLHPLASVDVADLLSLAKAKGGT